MVPISLWTCSLVCLALGLCFAVGAGTGGGPIEDDAADGDIIAGGPFGLVVCQAKVVAGDEAIDASAF